MGLVARLFALVPGFVGVAPLSWLATPSVRAILPGDPDVTLIGASVLIFGLSARLAILAPNVRTAWGRTFVLNGLCCLACAGLAMSKEPTVAGKVGAPILIALGVGAVGAAAGLALLAGAQRRGVVLQKTAAEATETVVSDFAPEETLLYRREGGANYRAFVQRIWASAEISMEPLAAFVDDKPCRIVSIARRPKGGCYVNVILDGVGYTLMAHAHYWSTEDGPVDIATWSSKLLVEDASDSRRAAR